MASDDELINVLADAELVSMTTRRARVRLKYYVGKSKRPVEGIGVFFLDELDMSGGEIATSDDAIDRVAAEIASGIGAAKVYLQVV